MLAWHLPVLIVLSALAAYISVTQIGSGERGEITARLSELYVEAVVRATA